jgi:hypothetical protein
MVKPNAAAKPIKLIVAKILFRWKNRSARMTTTAVASTQISGEIKTRFKSLLLLNALASHKLFIHRSDELSGKSLF